MSAPGYRYLVDTNVIVVFQKAGHLGALVTAASTVSMAMVDAVYDELTVPKPTRTMTPEMRKAEGLLRESAIEIEEIILSSAEDDLRSRLRARGNPGPGEAASVAFAVSRSDHIVVTTDRKAVAGAAKLYNELPGEVGRILGLHAFLRTLFERGALDQAIVATVAAVAKRESNLDPPLWWQAWAAEGTATSEADEAAP
ncbi:MAG: hypothetical protein ABI193_23210 [Minicystis sp.]